MEPTFRLESRARTVAEFGKEKVAAAAAAEAVSGPPGHSWENLG